MEEVRVDGISRPYLTNQICDTIDTVNLDENIFILAIIIDTVLSIRSSSNTSIKNRNVVHAFVMKFLNELWKVTEVNWVVSEIPIVVKIVNIRPLDI